MIKFTNLQHLMLLVKGSQIQRDKDPIWDTLEPGFRGELSSDGTQRREGRTQVRRKP